MEPTPNPNADQNTAEIYVEYPLPDGKVEKVTLAEAKNRLATYAGKAASFDAKAAEAADFRSKFEAADKEAAQTRRQKELLQKVNESNDPDAFRELGQSLGLDPAYVEAQIASISQAQPGAQEGAQVASGLSPADRALLQELRQLMGGYKKAGIDPIRDVLATRQFQEETTQSWAQQATRDWVLTNDPILGKMVKHPTHGATIQDGIWKKVDSLVKSGKKFSPETIQEAVKEYHGFANAFDAVFPAGTSGLHPGVLGSAPTADGGFSRLTPPKEPKQSDYGTSSEEFARYLSDVMTYQTAVRALK